MSIKKLFAAALLAAGFICQAQAATTNVVYVTGSTAFRSIVYANLSMTQNGTNVFDVGSPTAEAEFGGSSANGANYMLFYGTINGTPTFINCIWTGSEAGIASAAGETVYDWEGNPFPGSPATWLKADGSISLTGWTSASPTSGQLESSSHAADLAMSDTSQAVSLTPAVANTPTALNDFGVVGIAPFTWAKNYQSSPSAQWLRLTNITTMQALAVLHTPYPVAFFTGVAGDTNQTVYPCGRNAGSGTRANCLADLGWGHFNGNLESYVNQWSIGGGVSTPKTSQLILANESNGGYDSGGDLSTQLSIDGSCAQIDPNNGNIGWIAIGYLGTSDATKNNLSVANNWLTENGVLESNGAVEEGQYSFWGHEHLYGSAGISGYQLTVGGKLHDGIIAWLLANYSGPAGHDKGIPYSYMHCDKASDTAYPTR
jgi:hypothetical protein